MIVICLFLAETSKKTKGWLALVKNNDNFFSIAENKKVVYGRKAESFCYLSYVLPIERSSLIVSKNFIGFVISMISGPIFCLIRNDLYSAN